MSFFGKFFGSSSSSSADAAVGAGSAAPTNSNLGRMNTNLQAMLGAAGNARAGPFKQSFNAFKTTVNASKSPAYQSRLAQIHNAASSIEDLEALRSDIRMKVETLRSQYKDMVSKMSGLPEAVFKKVNEKYSTPLQEIWSNLTSALNKASTDAGKMIDARKKAAAKTMQNVSSLPRMGPSGPINSAFSHLPAEEANKMSNLQRRLASFKKGGSRRRRRSVKRRSHKRRAVA